MQTLAEIKQETGEAKQAILDDLERRNRSVSELLEQQNGDHGRFSSTAVQAAILELLQRREVRFSSDGRLSLRVAAAA